MDFSLRKCPRDRLTSLSDEVICEILSALPTKDAAVVSLSSKKMRNAFMWMTTLDFDDSPMYYSARNNPQLIERFQLFKTFVDNVLQISKSSHLSRFSLKFGDDFTLAGPHFHRLSNNGVKGFFPDLESTQLNTWIGFPLNHCGVREINLSIHVSKPVKLPSALFKCESLEVLKLDTNLDFDLISSMPSFRLLKLKVLQLSSIIIPSDDFVTKLLSNCPLLEELDMNCDWKYGSLVTISSPLLKKLALSLSREDVIVDSLIIDTPNLHYFEYEDYLAAHCSFTSMKALVEASLDLVINLNSPEESFDSMLVQHLTLCSCSLEVLNQDGLKNQMLMFHNLTHMELGYNTGKWDTLLVEFLKHSPILETLEFTKGINPWISLPPGSITESSFSLRHAATERLFFRTNQVNPSCCKSYLKRIVIKEYCGTDREVELVQFLLKIALILEELFVTASKNKAIQPSLKSTLENLPRASPTCLSIVQ